MTKFFPNSRTALVALALAGVLCGLPQSSFATVPSSQAQQAGAAGDQAALNAVAARLGKKQFRAVKVTVNNGIATLSGSVNLYMYKAEAEKRVSRAQGVTAVRNLIQVAGPAVPDSQLQAKLAKKLAYDRVGYGNAFNAITVSVSNGVVTLSGHARTDVDKNSAMDLVSVYPGVKDLVGNIQVDPVSIMDDQARLRLERAIYGDSFLSKYAVDPAKPIRISVQNGHVELYGTVDTQTDKEVASLRANSVPGVFSVQNYLEVAGRQNEAGSK